MRNVGRFLHVGQTELFQCITADHVNSPGRIYGQFVKGRSTSPEQQQTGKKKHNPNTWGLLAFVLVRRPDMTFAVDWALNNNYQSLCWSSVKKKIENRDDC